MVLTWIGIVFMVAVLIGWIVYENRRLIAYALGSRPRIRRAGRPAARDHAGPQGLRCP